MSIPDYHTLRQEADRQLSRAAQANKIVLIYAGLSAAAAALITVFQFIISKQISQTGGLANMGMRSVLSTFSEFLPLLQTVFILLLDFGYMACMLRVARGQYSSPNTLRVGMDRFGVIIRCSLLKALSYMGAAFVAFYLAMAIFLISPFSNTLMELLTPLASGSSLLGGIPAIDAATSAAIYRAIIPAIIIYVIVVLALVAPLFYRFRMTDYVIYDNPGQGALYAIRESRKMMQRNRLNLFKLDLRFWWYYLLMVLIAFIAYGDMLLELVGVTPPFSDTVGYFLFYFLSLAVQFASLYYLRNKIETIYGLVYHALCPPKQASGVVLGNIFQL